MLKRYDVFHAENAFFTLHELGGYHRPGGKTFAAVGLVHDLDVIDGGGVANNVRTRNFVLAFGYDLQFFRF